jgi:hypothetical protein
MCTGATTLLTTLTVNLTDVAAQNAQLVAPEVCRVTFILPDDYFLSGQEQMCLPESEDKECTLDRDGRDSWSVVFENEEAENITFDIFFNSAMMIGCSNYIPNTNYTGQGSAVLSCVPVYSCNTTFNDSTTLDKVQWWRFPNETVRDRFLEADDKSTVKDAQQVKTREGISTVSGNSLELMFTAAIHEVVGYYVTVFMLTGQQQVFNGQNFIVYASPVLDDSSEDVEVIFGTGAASDFRKVFCQFVSFPAANITWESPDGSSFTTTDTGEVFTLDSEADPTLSLNGRLVFEEVQYSDSGEYTCTAKNNVSGNMASDTIILRVRDPLRPLWPALGIVGSFLVTFMFIFGGALVDRARGKRGVEDDDGSFQRNYSIVSNLGDESSGTSSKRGRKHQPAGKRISITQQELLANASDLNNS